MTRALFLLSLGLIGCAAPTPDHALTVVETADIIEVHNGATHVLTYRKSEVPPPEGKSPLFRRSGFIHPLTAPNGDVVTGIHAPDHVHHFGLWHAWVKTRLDGRAVDFWNLRAGQGTVRYAGTDEIRRSEESVGFSVTQQHVILPDEVVLEETLSVDVRIDAAGNHLVDYVTVQTNVTESALELPAYRYGGCIAYRGPAGWKAGNSQYLTSEGKGREDGHTTRARWCSMSGKTTHGHAAVTILGHPDNHDAPQRQRIWPATKANQGAIFFVFVPTQEFDWALEPNEPSTMRYRLVVSDNVPDANDADAWFRHWTR